MSKKTYQSYLAVFKFIENYVFELKPAEVITDFETGLRKAINEHYPDAKLRGCWYHYCASISRKIAKKRQLTAVISENPGASLIRKQIMNLPLLPEDKFYEGYKYIQQTAIQQDVYNDFEAIFNYLESYWFVQVKSYLQIYVLFVALSPF